MKAFTALWLVHNKHKYPVLDIDEFLDGMLELEKLEQSAGVPMGTYSMGSQVPCCQCDECKAYSNYWINFQDKKRLVTTSGVPYKEDYLASSIVLDSIGAITGRLNTQVSNLSNIPRFSNLPPQNPRVPIFHSTPDLVLAHNMEKRKSVRPGRKKSGSFRILDHDPNWKSQNCSSRYRVIRWVGSTPYEWERVGWMVSLEIYDNRGDARRAKKELHNVADVMET
jgi:hypothetical protein